MSDADTLEPEYAGDEFNDLHLKPECKSAETVGNGCRVTSIYSVCRLEYLCQTKRCTASEAECIAFGAILKHMHVSMLSYGSLLFVTL